MLGGQSSSDVERRKTRVALGVAAGTAVLTAAGIWTAHRMTDD